MKEIKEILKNKSFVINPMLLKGINKFNLTLNEFLLLLYFINIKNNLDLEDIKKYLSLNDEEILIAFNSLTEKKAIEIIVKKNGKIVEEEISTDILYDRIILSEKTQEENKKTDIYIYFEKEFGRTLSPIEYETINNWLNNNIDEETIRKALKEAVLNGVSNLRYIDKILYEWTKKGNLRKDTNEEVKELFDYNWLDE